MGAQADIHVWSVDPYESPANISVLTNDDLQRAKSLPISRRALYTAAKSALRQLLSWDLGVDPSQIKIDRLCRYCGDQSHGKPSIANAKTPIDFSISYSSRLALVAVGHSTRVGVDIQDYVAGSLPHRWCFSAAERAYLAGLESGVRDVALAHAWARKEAVAKADGRGLALPLSQVLTTGPPSLWELPSGQWRLQDIDVGWRLAGALAYDVSTARIQVSSWKGSRISR